MHLLSVHDDGLLVVLGYCHAQDIFRASCSCKRLLKLSMRVEDLRCTGGISERALDFFYKLKHLSIVNAVNLTEERLLKIVCKCPSLISLQILRLNLVPGNDHEDTTATSRANAVGGDSGKSSALLTPEYDSSFLHQSQTFSMSSLDISRLYLEGHVFVSFFSDAFLHLQELTLDSCATINDGDMTMILTLCSDLSVLHARRMFSLKSLASIRSISPSLTQVSFQKCSQLQAFTLGEEILLKQLVDLDLSFTSITNSSLVSLLNSCPSVANLDIKQCTAIQEELLLSSPKIRSINAAMCVHVKKITLDCPELATLNILHCFELSSVSVLSNKLTELDLSMLTLLQSVKLKCPNLTLCLIPGCAKSVVDGVLEENPSLQPRLDGIAVSCVGSPRAKAATTFRSSNNEQVFEAERALRERLRNRRSSTIG